MKLIYREFVFAARAWIAEKVKHSGCYSTWRAQVNSPHASDPEVLVLECQETVAKEDVRDQVLSSEVRTVLSRRASSSGTSGQPLVFYQCFDALQREQAFLDFGWERVGYTRGARTAVVRGTVVPGGAVQVGNRLYVSGEGWTESDVTQKVAALVKFMPEFVHCYPSVLERLLVRAVAMGIDIPTGVLAVLAGSEEITETQVQIFRRLLGAETVGWYGQSEQVALAFRERDGTYSFVPGYSDLGFVKRDDAYEIVGRSRCNQAFRDMWYRTGDCCDDMWVGTSEFLGVRAVRCRGLQGRSAASLILRDGAVAPFNQMLFGAHSAAWLAVERYCFVQDAPGSLLFIYSRNTGVQDRLLDRLAAVLGHAFSGFDLKMIQLPELSRSGSGKWRYFFPSIELFSEHHRIDAHGLTAMAARAIGVN